MAIVVTNRLLVFENKQGEIDEGFLAREDPAIMYGIALGYSKLDNQQMPYMVVDQERSQDYIDKVVQHEFGHVFGVKRSGEYYDGESHCTNEQCLLQANRSESPDYCEECSGQFEENGYYFHGREVLGIKTPHHERNPQL